MAIAADPSPEALLRALVRFEKARGWSLACLDDWRNHRGGGSATPLALARVRENPMGASPESVQNRYRRS